MNDLLELIRTRHSIRRFEKRQIEEETLQKILEAGLYAPSSGNFQSTKIVVCQDAELNEQLGKINRWMMFKGSNPKDWGVTVSTDQPSIVDDASIKSSFYGAPTVLTIFSGNGCYSHDNAALVAENIMLAAHALGVGSCYIGRTEEVFATDEGAALRKKWGIPEDMDAVCNVLLGYRQGPEPHEKPRKENRIIFVR